MGNPVGDTLTSVEENWRSDNNIMSKLILALLIVAALVALSEAGRVRRDVICGVRGHRSLPLSNRLHF